MNEDKLVFQCFHFCSTLSEIVYKWMEPVNRKEEKTEQRKQAMIFRTHQ